MCVCLCVSVQSVPEYNGCGLFVYRIYEEFHINLWVCSMFRFCYLFLIQVYIKLLATVVEGD